MRNSLIAVIFSGGLNVLSRTKGDDEFNKLHEKLYNDEGELRELVTDSTDEEKQKQVIQSIFREHIEKKIKAGKSEQEKLAKLKKKEELFNEDDLLGFEKIPVPEQVNKAGKQPMLSIRPENPREPSSKLPQKSAHLAKDFDSIFLTKLKAKFTDSNKQTDGGMQFTGTESSVAKAANLYQEHLATKGISAVCEIEADSKEAAIAFMKKLNKEGFDITKISGITCDGQQIAKPKKLIEKAETERKQTQGLPAKSNYNTSSVMHIPVYFFLT